MVDFNKQEYMYLRLITFLCNILCETNVTDKNASPTHNHGTHVTVNTCKIIEM